MNTLTQPSGNPLGNTNTNAHSMEAIPQESDRIYSQQSLPQEESRSFELLIQAHDHIRNIENSHEELQLQVSHLEQANSQLQRENQRLQEQLREREVRLDNLEKINEKAIKDYVRLEREVSTEKREGRVRRNLTTLPNQLNSPLSPSIVRTEHTDARLFRRIENGIRESRLSAGKELARRQQQFQLNLGQNRGEWTPGEFTFDGGVKKDKSPCRQKSMKNCYSVATMSGLVNKVHSRHQSQLGQQKAKIKECRNYCSSMEKKYSPGVTSGGSRKKEGFIKNVSTSIKKCGSPKSMQFRGSVPGKFDLGSTGASTGGFGVWQGNRYVV